MPRRSLAQLRVEAAGCTACDLYKRATQTVFGEGGARASIMLVGEQPGDKEDREGHPFVGPAGALLGELMAAAGLDRKQVYMTNAVKHFSWTASGKGGKARLHKKPTARELKACGRWLEEELAIIKPKVVIALGATAARALLGAEFKLLASLGSVQPLPSFKVIATYHPSAILRMPDKAAREQGRAQITADLERARRLSAR